MVSPRAGGALQNLCSLPPSYLFTHHAYPHSAARSSSPKASTTPSSRVQAPRLCLSLPDPSRVLHPELRAAWKLRSKPCRHGEVKTTPSCQSTSHPRDPEQNSRSPTRILRCALGRLVRLLDQSAGLEKWPSIPRPTSTSKTTRPCMDTSSTRGEPWTPMPKRAKTICCIRVLRTCRKSRSNRSLQACRHRDCTNRTIR